MRVVSDDFLKRLSLSKRNVSINCGARIPCIQFDAGDVAEQLLQGCPTGVEEVILKIHFYDLAFEMPCKACSAASMYTASASELTCPRTSL